MDLKKQGAKNRVIDIQKEKRQQLFLFLNNNDPGFFLHPDFFHGHKPTQVSETRILGSE